MTIAKDINQAISDNKIVVTDLTAIATELATANTKITNALTSALAEVAVAQTKVTSALAAVSQMSADLQNILADISVGTPVAAFTWSANNLVVQFTDTSTEGTANDSIKSELWSFGDGSTSNTVGSQSHTYASANTYKVSLQVVDNTNATANVSQTITVSTAVPPPVLGKPVSAFSVSANGLVVTCTDQSTDTGGTITKWAWAFGDGSVSSSPSVVHSYAANGTYAILQAITDNTGATAHSTQNVTVVDTTVQPPPSNTAPNIGAIQPGDVWTTPTN